MPRAILLPLLILLMATVAAQDTPPDTLQPVPVDTVAVADSVLMDSSLTMPSDSAAAIAETGSTFEERREGFRQQRHRPPPLSLFDTLITYFGSERLNQRANVDRSFHHDAGDYFRFSPSYFLVEAQVTPMRKTVQPFGLSGDRLNIVSDELIMSPFQHQLEPDGLVDFSMVPTAADDDIFILPGPAGQLFGGRSSLAGVVTRPHRPVDSRPETAILGDKGGYGYSWVRGRYACRFESGRQIDASVDYRDGDGPAAGRSDHTYHYTGKFFFPLSHTLGLSTSGSAFDSEGFLAVRPDYGGPVVARGGFDRYGQVALDASGSDNTARYQIGYSYRRQGSYYSGRYVGNYYYTAHGGFFAADRAFGKTLLRARLEANYLEYDNYYKFETRRYANLSLVMARHTGVIKYALIGGGRYVRDYEFLPNAALVVMRETPRTFVMLSAGYSEREPSLHEGYLAPNRATLYAGEALNYANEGNESLTKEKQTVASALVELGTVDNHIRLSATGGKIIDGIDWYHTLKSDAEGDYTLFKPYNGDIDFVDVSTEVRINVTNVINLLGDGAWRQLEYARADSMPYQPEYQAFAGLELHYDWISKLTDLYLYGELVYPGPYTGYGGEQLGEEPVVNVKASIGLKDFRFSLVWQNMLDRFYAMREGQTNPGRFFYYGLVWNFLD